MLTVVCGAGVRAPPCILRGGWRADACWQSLYSHPPIGGACRVVHIFIDGDQAPPDAQRAARQ
eukprot:7058973-Lingulodinium_polyedra.AAC.1